jgi:hypothetical protein
LQGQAAKRAVFVVKDGFGGQESAANTFLSITLFLFNLTREWAFKLLWLMVPNRFLFNPNKITVACSLARGKTYTPSIYRFNQKPTTPRTSGSEKIIAPYIKKLYKEK